MPERIQLRRVKGWRLPERARSVARPTKWGNDFPVGFVCDLNIGGIHSFVVVRDRGHAVDLFISWQARSLERAARTELAGLDLACWCPLDEPCHADVLLALANEPRAEPTHSEDCETWGCAHCRVCGKGVLYGSRCHDHPNPLSSYRATMIAVSSLAATNREVLA